MRVQVSSVNFGSGIAAHQHNPFGIGDRLYERRLKLDYRLTDLKQFDKIRPLSSGLNEWCEDNSDQDHSFGATGV